MKGSLAKRSLAVFIAFVLLGHDVYGALVQRLDPARATVSLSTFSEQTIVPSLLLNAHSFRKNLLISLDGLLGLSYRSVKKATGPANALPEVPGYRVDGQIGQGRMSNVYLAKRQGSWWNKGVVIKIARDPLSELFLKREMTVLSALSEPVRSDAFPQLLEAGRLANGRIFLVLDYSKQDRTFLDYLQIPRGKNENVLGALQAMAAILEGIGRLHQKHFVHGDLKPSNILWHVTAPFGLAVKVIDFGSTFDDRTTTASHDFQHTFSPGYLSPEQAREDSKLTSAVDVFALGIVLYELLTGTQAMNNPKIVNKHIDMTFFLNDLERFKTELKGSPDVPEDLKPVILRATEVDPDDRYASADAMRQDVLNHLSTRLTPPGRARLFWLDLRLWLDGFMNVQSIPTFKASPHNTNLNLPRTGDTTLHVKSAAREALSAAA